MIGSISAELLVLRKRASTWILLAVWAVLGAFFGYVLPYTTYRNITGRGRPRRSPTCCHRDWSPASPAPSPSTAGRSSSCWGC